MKQILFIRHAESTVNNGDVAFGNLNAPLTQKALEIQIPNAKNELLEKYGINPDNCDKLVACSLYERAHQTAKELGFNKVDQLEILNESEIYNDGELKGVDVIKKHVNENGWLPEQELERARQIIKEIQEGKLNYEIFVSHGMVIAGIASELNRLGLAEVPFDSKRGYVPLQAQIVRVKL